MPGAFPVTTPVKGSMVATEGFPLVHVPPVVELNSVIVDPAQTEDGPVIGAGIAPTVTIRVAEQPPDAYDTVVVPGETPVTTPLALPTVATIVVLLLQTPPEGEPDKVVVPPIQTRGIPVIVALPVVTVTVFVNMQLPTVYVSVATPGLTATAGPSQKSNVTMDESLLDQQPSTRTVSPGTCAW